MRCLIQDTANGTGIGSKLVTIPEGYFGVLDINPQFVSMYNAIGNDSLWFTYDDGLKTDIGSPCIDAGRSIQTIYPEDWNSSMDICGKLISRANGKNYDIGAYDH